MESMRIIRFLDPKIKKVRVLEEAPMADLDECPPEKMGEDVPIYNKDDEDVEHLFAKKSKEEKEDALEKEESNQKMKERHFFWEYDDH